MAADKDQVLYAGKAPGRFLVVLRALRGEQDRAGRILRTGAVLRLLSLVLRLPAARLLARALNCPQGIQHRLCPQDEPRPAAVGRIIHMAEAPAGKVADIHDLHRSEAQLRGSFHHVRIKEITEIFRTDGKDRDQHHLTPASFSSVSPVTR